MKIQLVRPLLTFAILLVLQLSTGAMTKSASSTLKVQAGEIENSASLFKILEQPKLTEQQQNYLQALHLHKQGQYYFAAVDTSLLKQNASFSLQLPDWKRTYTVEAYENDSGIGGRLVLKGIPIAAEGEVILVLYKDMVTGVLELDHQRFRLFPLGGGLHVLVAQDAEPVEECQMGATTSGYQKSKPTETQDSSVPDDEDYYSVEKSMLGECKVRLLFAYTNAVDRASPDILSKIITDVNDFNRINQNSGVGFQVELACVTEVNYTESGTSTRDPLGNGWNTPTDLVRFWNPNDGFMDQVHNLRNQYDADLCQLYTTNLDGSGGFAMDFLVGANDAFCASLWNNGGFTPTHEFGHLFGMRHDVFVDNTLLPFPFGHGYTYTGTGTNFRTVMAYTNACTAAGQTCGVIPNWSNPDVNFNGNATGNGLADNALVANARDQTVAGFQGNVNHKSVFINDVIRVREFASLYGVRTLRTNGRRVAYNSGSSGEYVAADWIILQPGFVARSGASFKASLSSPCTLLKRQDWQLTEEDSILQRSNALQTESAKTITVDKTQFEAQFFPNPANQEARLTYQLPANGPVRIAIYDLNGQQVQLLVEQDLQEAGVHQLSIATANLSAGSYFCRIQTASHQKTVRFAVIHQ